MAEQDDAPPPISPADPCGNCGQHKNNQIEPRFGYVYCDDCKDVPPVRFGRQKPRLPFQ